MFDSVTTIGLLLTLVMIFSFQGNTILEKPLHIVLIAVPLILQTFLIFAIAYIACRVLKLPYKIAAPAGMICASNFFELAVAVAIALFGTTSPAALATTVGVLTEVPVMLFLVKKNTTFSVSSYKSSNCRYILIFQGLSAFRISQSYRRTRVKPCISSLSFVVHFVVNHAIILLISRFAPISDE